MKHRIIAAAAALAIASLSLFCVADTVHEVKRGETIFGIAYKYKVSVDDLQQWNPQARNGVKKGMKLLIKDGKEAESEQLKHSEISEISETSESSEPSETSETSETSESSEALESLESLGSLGSLETLGDSEAAEAATLAEGERNNILVLLPFTAESENPTRQAQFNADFYRGMLLAAKNLASRPGREVEIIALDTDNDLSLLETQLYNTSDRNIAVIVAPEDDAQYAKIVEYATPRGIYVINPFIFKDQKAYDNNPQVIRANISQDDMYAKAIDALLLDYAGFIPVILNPAGAKAEKEPFVNALKTRADSLGLPVQTLTFEGNLDDEALASLDPATNYVFIPKSGSLSIFNKFAPAIARLKGNPDRQGEIALFGYPDWTTFRNDAQVLLHQLGATIYSRFFYNESDPATLQFQDQFIEWYGVPALEVLPNQGVLGYDTGAFLIEAMQQGPLQRALLDSEHHGVQNSFRFQTTDPEKCASNIALYIITFKPDSTTSVEII